MHHAGGKLWLIEKSSGFRREVLRTLNLALNEDIAALADRDLSNLLFLAFFWLKLQHFWISFATSFPLFFWHFTSIHVASCSRALNLIDCNSSLHCVQGMCCTCSQVMSCVLQNTKVQRFHLDKACSKTGSSETIGRRESIWWFRESCFDQPHHCWQCWSHDGFPHVGSFLVHKT